MSTGTIAAEDVVTIVECIFDELLGLGVERAAEPDQPDPGARLLTGRVWISGAWQGAVTVDCPYALARRTAAVMLGGDPADEADVVDVLGEITNMTGGNIKALLPGPSELSLPVVTERGSHQLPAPGEGLPPVHTEVIARLGFECQGLPLTVTVAQGGTPG